MSLGDRAPHSLRKRSATALLLALLTFGEALIFQRLLFRDRPEYEFALASVSGVLNGTPAFKSWQQRFLGPWLVSVIEPVAGGALRAFELYIGLGLLLSNALLYFLLRRKNVSEVMSVLGVVCFVFVRIVFAYRLEYAWDGIDVLLFLGFGSWVARGGSLLPLMPLLVIGTLNHETALFIPVWYVLAQVFRSSTARDPDSSRRLPKLLGAVFALAVMMAAIWFLRDRYYVGSPHLPGSTLGDRSSALGNEFHLMHNLNQLIIEDWRSGRIRIAVSLWLSLFLLVREIVKKGEYAPAALWSLCVFGSISCFGYVNETRLYLPLIAFWFAYAWPSKWLEIAEKSKPIAPAL